MCIVSVLQILKINFVKTLLADINNMIKKLWQHVLIALTHQNKLTDF